MSRQVVLRLLVPLLATLHFFIHLGLGIGTAAPDLLTLALLLAAREVGMGTAGGIGLVFGLLEDSFSVLAFGANAVALTVVGIVGARTREFFVGETVLFFFFYLAGGKWLRELVHWVVAGEGIRGAFLDDLIVGGTVAAIYMALVGIVILLPFGKREVLP